LRLSPSASIVLVVALIAALAAQVLFAAHTNSATADESEHIVSGLAALRTGDFRMSVAHPPLMDLLCGAAAWAGGAPPMPTDLESWREAQHLRYSYLYFWRGPAAAMAPRLVFLARLPVLLVSIGLALLAFTWARKLYGRAAGLFALGMYCFEPNLLAHSAVAGNDLGAAAGFVLTVYLYWRYLQCPNRWLLVLTGAAVGLTLLAKFSGLLLLGILPVLAVIHATAERRLPARRLALGLASVAGVAALVVWAGYGFGLQPVARFARDIGLPENARIPAGQFVSGFLYQVHHEKVGHPAFLLGQTSSFGWWYYFPITILVKTSLPLLVLLAVAVSRRRFERDELFLVAPAILYLGASMSQSLNYGVRHILPVYPLLIIFAARVLARPWSRNLQRWGPRLVGVLAAGVVLEAVVYAPQYLAYFNRLAGGPEGGARVLLDSNLDWGQDLKRLASWQNEHPDSGPLFLAYLGSADPTRYGVEALPMPGLSPNWPPADRPPEWYGPQSVPRRGWLAVSAHVLGTHPGYRWLRSHEPIDRAGYSILIYHIPGT
jgi:hypothetical protein